MSNRDDRTLTTAAELHANKAKNSESHQNDAIRHRFNGLLKHRCRRKPNAAERRATPLARTSKTTSNRVHGFGFAPGKPIALSKNGSGIETKKEVSTNGKHSFITKDAVVGFKRMSFDLLQRVDSGAVNSCGTPASRRTALSTSIEKRLWKSRSTGNWGAA